MIDFIQYYHFRARYNHESHLKLFLNYFNAKELKIFMVNRQIRFIFHLILVAYHFKSNNLKTIMMYLNRSFLFDYWLKYRRKIMQTNPFLDQINLHTPIVGA